MVTRGHRTIGRTIRKLANSVEFSDKENLTKNLDMERMQESQTIQGDAEDSPIQDLRIIAKKNNAFNQ